MWVKKLNKKHENGSVMNYGWCLKICFIQMVNSIRHNERKNLKLRQIGKSSVIKSIIVMCLYNLNRISALLCCSLYKILLWLFLIIHITTSNIEIILLCLFMILFTNMQKKI